MSKRITITADFSGYPDEVNERVFRTGETPDDLDDAYADLLIAKGLAEPAEPAKAETTARPALAAPAPAAPITEKKDTDA